MNLSFTNEPLLHQILALSAYHLAYQNPDQRHVYAPVGAQHQSDAAEGLRTALLQVTPETCHAVFISASLLIVSTFARLAIAQEDDEHQPTLNDIIEILVLIRGMSVILNTFEPTIQSGIMADLFRPSVLDSQQSMDIICEKLEKLSQTLQDRNVDGPTALSIDKGICSFIQAARKSVTEVKAPPLRVTMMWPTWLTDDLLSLIRHKEPPALAFLSYYCLVVHDAAANAWYMKGWGRKVAQDLATYLVSPWKEEIQWPLDQMK